MSLQQQLSRETPDSAEKDAFNSRLSRVVSKLFSRVLKAEEGTSSPYADDHIDVEALLCWMDDLLVSCGEMTDKRGNTVFHSSMDTVDACREMVNTLVQAIISAHGSTSVLYEILDSLEIDRKTSLIGQLISIHDDEAHSDVDSFDGLLDDDPPPPIREQNEIDPSREVASLVSALVSAPIGPPRQAALTKLRQFKAQYGDEELNAHLQQVSSTFRSFIEEQLGHKSPHKISSRDDGDSSMSARLQSLRSRIKGSDNPPQLAVEGSGAPVETMAKPALSSTQSPTARRTRLAQPSPSRLVSPKTRSTVSLRGRLNEPQEQPNSSDNSVSSSMGRAAALRARLEAVKKQGHP